MLLSIRCLSISFSAIAFASAQPMPTWQEVAPMAVARSEIRAVVINDRFYVVGGYSYGTFQQLTSLEAYNPVNNTWATLAPAPIGMDHHMMAAHGGLLFVLKYANIHIYDPVGNSWSTRPEGGNPRSDGTAVTLGDYIYVMGGSTTLPLQRYHAVNRTWENLAAMPFYRAHTHAVVFNNEIWMLAGRNGNAGATTYRTVSIYNPANNQWRPGPPMDSIRSGHAAEVVNGRIIVAGGEIPGSPSWSIARTAEIYNPMSGGWSFLPETPTPIHGVASATWNGRFYLLGGATVAGTSTNHNRNFYLDIAAVSLRPGLLPKSKKAVAFRQNRSTALFQWNGGFADLIGRDAPALRIDRLSE